MKKHLKIVMSILGVASLLGGLSSCGGNNNISSTNNNSSTITINFWHTFGQGIVDELNRKVSNFETLVKENENIDVKINLSYQGSYDDLEAKVINALATGDAPNIAVAYPDHVANYLSSGDAAHEFVVNMEDYINNATYGLGKEAYLGDDEGVEDMVPAFLAEGTEYAQEGTYSFPLMKSTEIMFYNKRYMPRVLQLYNAAKGTTFSNPDTFLASITWDEFMDVCEVVSNNASEFGSSGAKFYPAVYDSDSNLFISQLIQSGQKFISLDNNGNGVLDFDSAEARAMVTDLKADYDKGLFTTKGALGEYGSNYFTSGQSVFSIGSSGGASYNAPTGYSFEMGMCKVPPRTDKDKIDEALYVSQGPTLTILNNLRKSEEVRSNESLYSWKFIKYLTTTENNIDLALNSGGYVPVRLSSYESEEYSDYLAETGDLLPQCASLVVNSINGHYFNTPVFKGSSTARDEAGSIITQVLLGNSSVDVAFTNALNQTRLMM